MNTSNYEQTIINILKAKQIPFKREQSFYGLRGFKQPLRFDFVTYNADGTINSFIEVNGEQHYKEIPAWGGQKGLLKRKEYDRKKMAYSLANGIPLYCLPYWDINSKLTYDKITNTSDYLVKSIWHADRNSKK